VNALQSVKFMLNLNANVQIAQSTLNVISLTPNKFYVTILVIVSRDLVSSSIGNISLNLTSLMYVSNWQGEILTSFTK